VFRKSILGDASVEEMRILTDEIQEKNVEMIFKEPQFDD
jgi:hypothetical protein